jgi:hypothetical protein
MPQHIIEVDSLQEPQLGKLNSGLGTHFEILEILRDLGFDHYSVCQTSLDQVFLSIIERRIRVSTSPSGRSSTSDFLRGGDEALT